MTVSLIGLLACVALLVIWLFKRSIRGFLFMAAGWGTIVFLCRSDGRLLTLVAIVLTGIVCAALAACIHALFVTSRRRQIRPRVAYSKVARASRRGK